MILRNCITLLFTLLAPATAFAQFITTPQVGDLVVNISNGPFDEQNRADAVVEVETRTPPLDPEEILLDINILGGIALESWSAAPGITCVQKGEHWLQCDVAKLNYGAKTAVTMKVRSPFDARTGFIGADLVWHDRGFRPERRTWRKDMFRYLKEFAVTNANDAGPGSLRQAIIDSNAACSLFEKPCLIRFDLGENATIRPVDPLPHMTAQYVTIDGKGQVVLDGSSMTYPANGLVASGFSDVTIRDLTVRGFPENGIEIGRFARIESCRITGNGSRGVMVVDGGSAQIADCVIGGNRRSGVFVNQGSASVLRTFIGVDRDGVTPMPNGASGVFVHRDQTAAIIDGVIAHNEHFGVATVRENRNVDIIRTRIVANRQGEIDIDMDGSSRFPPARIGERFPPPNGPTLLSATYDPLTDKTTVRGVLEGVEISFALATYDLQFYATTAANGASQFLGGIHISKPDFVFTVNGDLRGRFITSHAIRWIRDEINDRMTSELSTPIEVTTQ